MGEKIVWLVSYKEMFRDKFDKYVIEYIYGWIISFSDIYSVQNTNNSMVRLARAFLFTFSSVNTQH